MKKNVICILLISFMFLVFPLRNVSALTYINGERIDWAKEMTLATSINYWLAPGNTYTVSIPNAVQTLMYPNTGQYNPLNLYPTTIQQKAKIELYQDNNVSPYTAATSVYRKNSSGIYYAMPIAEKDTYDWVWAKIILFENNMVNLSSDLKKTIIVHEMLHAYGLRDLYNYSNNNSIMHGYWDQWTQSVIQAGVTNDANNILNEKYN